MISLILSGGIGSRLWPISREKNPKQFAAFFEESLFDGTARRLAEFGEVQVCTGESLKTLTEMAIQKSNLKIAKAFYEPMGRNTAPAIALVCLQLVREKRENEILGVFPSDHWVNKKDVFAEALKLANVCAEKDQIVTIGIQPDHPATGFGYIECQTGSVEELGSLKAFLVSSFKEKPNKETAQKYLDSGHFFWNSGMFVFKVKTMVSCFENYMPEMWSILSELKNDMSNLSEIYSKLPSESIDYGVMEHAKNQVNIPCDIGWSDLGSWDDFAGAGKLKTNSKMKELNVDASNCFSYGNKDKTLCFLGVEDLIVVDTEDALLVTKKGATQDVKKVVDTLKEKNKLLIHEHVFENRPWGSYQTLHEEASFKSKVIQVDPGQQLSYQSHTKRSEIWVIVQGQGEVVLNDDIVEVFKGKIVEIPVGAKHRMRNTGSDVLKFVEVQLGDYFGEDDITRYEDDYKRV